ncbi:MAG: DUF5131 family protein [Bradymonadaceae bacterium]
MSDIQWTTETWNPTIGCRRVSTGCENCYAERMAARHANNPDTPQYDGIAEFTDDGPRWSGEVKCLPEKLPEPLHWKKPRRVFVDSMSDLFHTDVPFEFVARIYAVAAMTPRHTYQILTKRPERARAFFDWVDAEHDEPPDIAFHAHLFDDEGQCAAANSIAGVLGDGYNVGWPPRNIWLGVSTENQQTADERIPTLLETPAAVRFISAEPLLESINLRWIETGETTSLDPLDGWRRRSISDSDCAVHGDELQYYDVDEQYMCNEHPALDWVIVGGESGHDARPCRFEWIDQIRRQCEESDVPCFVKQLGSNPRMWNIDDGVHDAPIEDFKGADPDEWPDELHVRQYPEDK